MKLEILNCKYGVDDAVKQCDRCFAALCGICGYILDGKDYCNECWAVISQEKTNN